MYVIVGFYRLVMKEEESRRLLNVKLTTNKTKESVLIEMLYPTIYTFSCKLRVVDFPFDRQSCVLTFGSWTYDAGSLDYFPISDTVGMSSYIPNEGWDVIGFYGTVCTLTFSICFPS